MIKSSMLGQGRFGKCVLGNLGPLNVCVKICKPEKIYEAYFNREAQMLLQCCHPNLPMLYGVCIDGQNFIIMSFHGLDKETSLSLHDAVCPRKCHLVPVPEFSMQQWKTLICGVISAVHYLHEQKILHNDIKGDNIVIDKGEFDVRSVLIDLGKACYIHEAKKYSLSTDEKKKVYIRSSTNCPRVKRWPQQTK